MERSFFLATDSDDNIYGLFASRENAQRYVVPDPVKEWDEDDEIIYYRNGNVIYYVESVPVRDI